MKGRDLATMMGVALVTATLTLTVFWASYAEAGADGAAAAKIAAPKLTVNGIEMTLTTANGRPLHPDSQPELKLTATNVTDREATATVEIAMVATPRPTSNVARMPRIPRAIWSGQHTWTLKPHESGSLVRMTATSLPANAQTDVMLREATTLAVPVRSGIVALSYAAPVPAASSRDGAFPLENRP